MPRTPPKVVACDCETDPFLHGREPRPFIWGTYDGQEFLTFNTTEDFVSYWSDKNVILYAHNGGKFDFIFLLPFITQTRARIINGRIVQFTMGRATLRDSWSIIPIPLKDYIKDEIEYWKLEAECREEHRAEITAYLRTDCVSLYELVTAYRREAGTQVTIASNALAFAKHLGVNPGRTNHRYDNKFRPFYYGGRTECFKVGQIRNVNVYDIKSQYPFAMSHDLPTGPDYVAHSSIKGIVDKQIGRSFVIVECDSYGAFPSIVDGKLDFPIGRKEFLVTGWEYINATNLGLIKKDKVKLILTHDRTINFEKYVNYWFAHKDFADARGDKAQRIVGKIMLNSLYGKMAQNPIEYFDYECHSPGTPVDYENGWRLGNEMYGTEIHERPVLWRYQQKWGTEWMKFPIHYNVATAASITGFARAMLMDGIFKAGISNVVYCDTDSLVLKKGADTTKLRQDGKIGAWDWEGFSEVIHVGGKKLYAMRFNNGPKTGEEKIATKGAKLNYDEIATIAAGGEIIYKREAPTFSLVNGTQFLVRKIRATAQPKLY